MGTSVLAQCQVVIDARSGLSFLLAEGAVLLVDSRVIRGQSVILVDKSLRFGGYPDVELERDRGPELLDVVRGRYRPS